MGHQILRTELRVVTFRVLVWSESMSQGGEMKKLEKIEITSVIS